MKIILIIVSFIILLFRCNNFTNFSDIDSLININHKWNFPCCCSWFCSVPVAIKRQFSFNSCFNSYIFNCLSIPCLNLTIITLSTSPISHLTITILPTYVLWTSFAFINFINYDVLFAFFLQISYQLFSLILHSP